MSKTLLLRLLLSLLLFLSIMNPSLAFSSPSTATATAARTAALRIASSSYSSSSPSSSPSSLLLLLLGRNTTNCNYLKCSNPLPPLLFAAGGSWSRGRDVNSFKSFVNGRKRFASLASSSAASCRSTTAKRDTLFFQGGLVVVVVGGGGGGIGFGGNLKCIRTIRTRTRTATTGTAIRTTTSTALFAKSSNSDDDAAIESGHDGTTDDYDDYFDDDYAAADDDAIDNFDLESSATTSDTIHNDESSTTTTTSIIDTLPKGIPETFSILHHHAIPSTTGISMSDLQHTLSPEIITRLDLSPTNVSLPIALMMMFPEEFESQSKARKECRRGVILIHRGPLSLDDDGDDWNDGFNRDKMFVGRVGDRVFPGDVLAIQTRMTGTRYISSSSDDKHFSAPPFHLPVVYQDDHFAIVNKPEGIVVFGSRNGGHGRQTVKAALPYALNPPEVGVVSVMRRPQPVHRLDRATSGLLLVAKTKPAMTELSRQFKDRRVKKTYTAIVNGFMQEPKETSITSFEAQKLGVCVDVSRDKENEPLWQLIDQELEGQSAVTVWRPIKQWPLENAWNDTVTMVELKPKTGRYHQLRRHCAWVGERPILGDKSYDGGGKAKLLRENGLYLCSNKVTLEHPYYNTPQGRKEWNEMKERGVDPIECLLRDFGNVNVGATEESDGLVLIHAEIDLPGKFNEF